MAQESSPRFELSLGEGEEGRGRGELGGAREGLGDTGEGLAVGGGGRSWRSERTLKAGIGEGRRRGKARATKGTLSMGL